MFPGAAEECDGIDNDCDPSTDELVDGDGDGDSVCDGDCDDGDADMNLDDLDGDGWSPCDGDCDDEEYQTNPDALEYCNGTDDDCDGEVDEADAADAPTWFRDSDEDGYGNESVTAIGCDPPPGYVADESDCDDSDAGIHPEQLDAPSDGVDTDCDG